MSLEVAENLPGISTGILMAPVAPGAHGKKARAFRMGLDSRTTAKAQVYRKDVVFKLKLPIKRKPRLRERGEIKGFSAASARRLRLLIRNTDDLWTSFLTLTYPGPSFGFSPESLDGPTVKKHVHAFCTWLGRQKIAYVWILEFQERGVPHFHFLLSGFVPRDLWRNPDGQFVRVNPKKNKEGKIIRPGKQDGAVLINRGIESIWASIVASNDPRHVKAGTQVKGVKNPDQVGGYMGAYMSKIDQKSVPATFEKVGRFWGASRCLSKVEYELSGVYREISRELRDWRRENRDVRRWISFEQAQLASIKTDEARTAEKDGKKHQLLEQARRCAYRSELFAKRWRWKGFGFTLLRGAEAFRGMLRQAVAVDRGFDEWEQNKSWAWRKLPDGSMEIVKMRGWKPAGTSEVRKYETPEERGKREGQGLLFGGVDQTIACPKKCKCGEHPWNLKRK